MSVILIILAKGLWCAVAAVAFASLFNAPLRALLPTGVSAFMAGLVKFGLMAPAVGASIVMASFLASVMVGVLSIPIAHIRHVTPMIFAIPAVIPLVPGVFAFRTMNGLMKLTLKPGLDYTQVLTETIHYGVNTLFIILALSLGVAVPMHIMRKESVKKVRMRRLR